MGSKLGFILTLFFIIEVIAYSGDLYSIQAIHSSLDAAALTIAKVISLEGTLTQEALSLIEKNKAVIGVENSYATRPGDVFVFTLSREYDPLVMSQSTVTVSVTRSTVIGYLD
ncbi:MAG: hypothetical protein MJ241_00940 [Bacilli bacterium]|nr:hypothetical protein [Bacilli bacterium]